MYNSLKKLFIILLIGLIATSVVADPVANSYQTVRKNYFALRNTDPEVNKLDDWLKVGRELAAFADQNQDAETAAPALFNAGVLYARVYKSYRQKDYLDRSLWHFQRLVQRYPDSSLADDALIQRGDLFLDFKKDKSKAESAYLEVVEAYPDADLYEVAERKLVALTGRPIEKKPDLDLDVIKDPQSDLAQVETETVAAVETNDEDQADQVPIKKVEVKSLDSLAGRVIVIDPGHGGEDFGAVGKGGLLEKDVTLLVALELEKLIEKKLGAKVRLTRRTDVFVPLAERTNLANDFEAELFISLHVNSSDRGKGKGFETFYLDNTDSAASQKLAERENASIKFEGPEGDLQFMLSDLIQSAKRDESIALANLIQDKTVSHLNSSWKPIINRGVKTAPFYVLVGAHMPCVLVEMFFINNSEEGVRLSKSEFRKDLAEGLLTGIEAYFKHIHAKGNE
ncbi:MAG: N-acetylmuramoyl-L-alanine amidase [Bdellovibrionota bacterium]